MSVNHLVQTQSSWIITLTQESTGSSSVLSIGGSRMRRESHVRFCGGDLKPKDRVYGANLYPLMIATAFIGYVGRPFGAPMNIGIIRTLVVGNVSNKLVRVYD